MNGPLKTIVCGTRFGENYISALLEDETDFELAGILARGSDRSRQLARDLGVPLFQNPDQVPSSVDIACVAIRSRAFRGSGDAIAEALLRKGIHVLQEHPVHPVEIRRLLAASKEGNAVYHVNCFYSHGTAGSVFIRFLGEWRAARAPSYLTLTTSSQLLYSSLDIVGRAFGGLRDFVVGPVAPWPAGMLPDGVDAPPFQVLQGRIGSTPFVLQLQNYLDPRDPDHHSLVMHNIAAGGPEGRIELVNSFGPVVWSHAIYMPDYELDDRSASYLHNWSSKMDNRFLSQPTARTIGDSGGPNLADAGMTEFPRIIHRALEELKRRIDGSGPERVIDDDGLVALGTAWQRCVTHVGPLVECALPPPPVPVPDPAAFANGRDAKDDIKTGT